jgi:hypothetical protein
MPENSRSFFLKCGRKQKTSAAVVFSCIEPRSAAVVFSSLEPRSVKLPCDPRLIDPSEDNFFCGAKHSRQDVDRFERDCFVQVQ